MKTTLQHLSDLREPQATQAIANLHAGDTDGEIASTKYYTLTSSLFNAFDWGDSPQGGNYWDDIYDSLLDGTYYDAPQITPESLKCNAIDQLFERLATEGEMEEMEEIIASALPTDAAARKEHPVYSGFINYFPHAIAAVSHLSYKGNQQHHPDKPLHWDMDKSSDELDAMMRHVIDGDWEQVAWRAMANLERKLTGKCQYELDSTK